MKETDGNQYENRSSTHNSTMAAISLFHTTQCIAIIYYYCKYSSMFTRLLVWCIPVFFDLTDLPSFYPEGNQRKESSLSLTLFQQVQASGVS